MTATTKPDGLDIMGTDYKDDVVHPSLINKFFKGKNVLVTGGTGFIGSLIIEKLLRVAEVNKIYLIIRPKKGKDVNKRFEEVFEGPLFEEVKSKINIQKYVEIVNGDCAEKDLALSLEDRQRLIENVNVIFHGAATVKFDEPLRKATNINVRGTLDIMKLAKQMLNLQAVVHISTAFCNCEKEFIEEKVYPPGMPYEQLISLVESMDDEYLERMKNNILGKWPNTYVFTKQIAEDVCQYYSQYFPIAIVRPSIRLRRDILLSSNKIVTATKKEPIGGWINNMYGVTGIIAGAALGILRTLHCDKTKIAELVPADFVVNCVIAAAWDVAQETKDRNTIIKKNRPTTDVPVYNYVSGPQNPITWEEVMKFTEVAGDGIPSPLAIWHYWFTLNSNYYVHLIYTILFHFLPALIVDAAALIFRKQVVMTKLYKKIFKITNSLSYFNNRNFIFNNENTRALFKKLTPGDKELYNFDITSFEWQDYYFVYIKGMRVYLVNDPMETIPEGRKKKFRLMVAHYTVTAILVLLLGLLIWSKISSLFS